MRYVKPQISRVRGGKTPTGGITPMGHRHAGVQYVRAQCSGSNHSHLANDKNFDRARKLQPVSTKFHFFVFSMLSCNISLLKSVHHVPGFFVLPWRQLQSNRVSCTLLEFRFVLSYITAVLCCCQKFIGYVVWGKNAYHERGAKRPVGVLPHGWTNIKQRI